MTKSHSDSLPRCLDQSDHFDIQLAIRAELDAAAKSYQFIVRGIEWIGGLLSVEIDSGQSRDGLKETLEDSTASWREPESAFGEVLSVDIDRGRINLRYIAGKPPAIGTHVFVTAPRYLESLLEAWTDAGWVSRMIEWYNSRLARPEFVPGRGGSIGGSRWLRERQQLAFQLPAWSTSFLHGPPGTGKTYTIGALLARMLIEKPDARVLLVSSTNIAVDQALISVDSALESERVNAHLARSARSQCARIGMNFRAKLYEDRSHLLPAPDNAILQELAQLESARPDPQDVRAYADWKNKMQSIRQRMRARLCDVAGRFRLLAMTATSATYQMEALRSACKFDFVLMDEASQLSAAHALALAPLAPAVCFAGDPHQLPPITLTAGARAKQWLGSSMFNRMEPEKPNCVLLNEQSRMRGEICKVVSDTFYGGKLIVAKECDMNRDWHMERAVSTIPSCGASPVVRLRVESDGVFNHYYKGPCRKESADLIAGVVEELYQGGLSKDQLAILTPYHAQRTVIRQSLERRQIRGTAISTVHSVQGSERHTVIFDPVQGGDNFFRTEMGGDHLINVALSRAMARLIVVLSPGDRANPTLNKVATAIAPDHIDQTVPTVQTWMGKPDYPRCLIGRMLRVPGLVGKVVRISIADGMVYLHDAERACERGYSLAVLESKIELLPSHVTAQRSQTGQGTPNNAESAKTSRPPIVLQPVIVKPDMTATIR